MRIAQATWVYISAKNIFWQYAQTSCCVQDLYFYYLFHNTILPNIVTCLSPSLSLEEHRPSMTVLHLVRLWAIFSSLLSSASVSLLQLFLGRALFLFSCGFHLSAWRVVFVGSFLSVCPIQLHFRFTICLSIDSCSLSAKARHSRFFSGHLMQNIYLRRLLMRVWIFCRDFLVILRVSEQERI